MDDIEIHTEADEPQRNQTSSGQEHVEKLERTQRVEVLDPVLKKKPHEEKLSSHSFHASKITEFNKDIVITGKPKLNGNVVIDTTFHYKHPHKTTHKENYIHTENITGFNIDDVSPIKSHSSATHGHVGPKMTAQVHQHKAYDDYAAAHKVLNKNIEKLRNVLKAIEDVPVSSRVKDQGIEKVKKNDGELGRTQHSNKSVATTVVRLSGTPVVATIPSYIPPAGYKVLKTQSSTQTTVTKVPGPPNAQPLRPIAIPVVNTPPIRPNVGDANPLQDASANQSELPHTSGFPLGAQPVSRETAPGLHVIQGKANPLNVDVSTQASADVVDHIASELVDHSAGSQANGYGPGHWVKRLHPNDTTLQETLKELKPDDTKICKLEFISYNIINYCHDAIIGVIG